MTGKEILNINFRKNMEDFFKNDVGRISLQKFMEEIWLYDGMAEILIQVLEHAYSNRPLNIIKKLIKCLNS